MVSENRSTDPQSHAVKMNSTVSEE